MEITIEQQIAEVKREIAMRERVYPRWIEQGRLGQGQANHQIGVMKAVLQSLLEIQKQSTNQQALF